MARVQRTIEFWFEVIEEFEASNVTQNVFAKQKGLALSTFRKWFYKIREENQHRESVSFVQVSLPPVASTQRASLFFPQDLILEFSEFPEVDYTKLTSGIFLSG